MISMLQQKDPKTGELEGLSFDFDLCEAVAAWEQVSLPMSYSCISCCHDSC